MKTLIAPAIRVTDLTYRYEKAKKSTLTNINFNVETGKLVAVMGETGSGKTTLFMTLNGLIPQFTEGHFTGSVLIDQQSTLQLPIQQFVKNIGLVLQDPETQIFGLNVWEDVAFGPSNFSIPLAEIQERVKNSLHLVGLDGYDQRSTEFLSGGEKQRLAVAGILAIGPHILLLDEPTSELDPQGKEQIFQIILKLKEEFGMTILIAEHESERILEYADEVIVLQAGEIKWQGLPEDLFSDEELVKKFHLRPPGIATLYWNWKKRGFPFGEKCPKNVPEMKKNISKWIGHQSISSPFTKFHENTAFAPTNEKKVVLQISNLHHTYPNGQVALTGIDLNVYEGDFIAIIGQNGAGKSTFCKHFNGLLTPTQGKILFRGEDIKNKETHQLAAKIGYVFQNPDNQIFSATVLEEVMYGLKVQNLPEDVQREKALEALRFVDLETYANTHPFSLSKGLRQRLAVASVLVLEPDVLIIDEPTTGQDWKGAESILQLVNKLHRKGHTIMMITHNMSIVTHYAHRVLIMSQGKLLKDCTPQETFTDMEILKQAHITPTQIVEIAKYLEGEFHLPSQIISSDHLTELLWERIKDHA